MPSVPLPGGGGGAPRVCSTQLKHNPLVDQAACQTPEIVAEDPIGDYWVVREELRLYNPSYCGKPHVVALNKMDLEDACDLEDELRSDLTAMASQMQASPLAYRLLQPRPSRSNCL